MSPRLCDGLTRSSTSRPNLPQHREILSETWQAELISREKAHTQMGTSGSQAILFLETTKALSFKINRGIKLAKGMLITS